MGTPGGGGTTGDKGWEGEGSNRIDVVRGKRGERGVADVLEISPLPSKIEAPIKR